MPGYDEADGQPADARQAAGRHAHRERAVRAARAHGRARAPLLRLVRDVGGPAGSGKPRRPRRQHHPADLPPEQHGAAPPPGARGRRGIMRAARLAADPVEMARPADDLASMRHGALRRAIPRRRARSLLQGLGARQPLRGRRRLLSVLRRGQPGAHHRGAGAAGRRPHPRAASAARMPSLSRAGRQAC